MYSIKVIFEACNCKGPWKKSIPIHLHCTSCPYIWNNWFISQCNVEDRCSTVLPTWLQPGRASYHRPGQLTIIHYSPCVSLKETSHLVLFFYCLKVHLEPRLNGIIFYSPAGNPPLFEEFCFTQRGREFVHFGKKHWLCARRCFVSQPESWILFSRLDCWLCLGNIWLDDVLPPT